MYRSSVAQLRIIWKRTSQVDRSLHESSEYSAPDDVFFLRPFSCGTIFLDAKFFFGAVLRSLESS